MKRFLAAILAALALTVSAEPAFNGPLSVTSTSQTVTFAARRTSVTVINNSASANEMYVRVFTNCDTAAAATTAAIEIKAGEIVTFSFNATTECGSGYTAISLVCDTAETATARVISK